MDEVLKAIDDWWRTRGDEREFSLSASVIGDECQRRIWYKLNGAPKEEFSGRMKRLFDRGHREEGRFIDALTGIGVSVTDQQKKVLFADGRRIGAIDGIANGKHLLEFKTANDKSFKKIVKEGPPLRHKIQMNVYMHFLPFIDDAWYFAINKNDDEIYGTVVPYDKEFAQAQMQKIDRITALKVPPQRIDDRPEFYICKMCYLRNMCHDLA